VASVADIDRGQYSRIETNKVLTWRQYLVNILYIWRMEKIDFRTLSEQEQLGFRKQAIKLIKLGRKKGEVALIIGVRSASISEWWKNYKDNGIKGLSSKKRGVKSEDKKLLSDWRQYPKQTYQMFSFLNSNLILETLSNKLNTQLLADHGLHGGGWHIHANGGKLNPHLDYSIHPMLKMQRKLNLIIYLCKDWQDEYGGHFGLYAPDSDTNRSGNLVKEISVGFNKAVLFDTTQNSWHGLTKQVNCPTNQYRKSLAIYYLTTPPENVDTRSRALFSPTEEQRNDNTITELIEKRADFNKSKEVYIG
jgi:hypothetical protein